jgi:hypothetical protein
MREAPHLLVNSSVVDLKFLMFEFDAALSIFQKKLLDFYFGVFTCSSRREVPLPFILDIFPLVGYYLSLSQQTLLHPTHNSDAKDLQF